MRFPAFTAVAVMLAMSTAGAQPRVDLCTLVTVADLRPVFEEVGFPKPLDPDLSAGGCAWEVTRSVKVPGRTRPQKETETVRVTVLTAESIRRDFNETNAVAYFRSYMSPERKDGGPVSVGDEAAMASRPGPGFRRTTLKARKGNRLIELVSNHPDTDQLQAAARVIVSKL